jgi:hypothetical protein
MSKSNFPFNEVSFDFKRERKLAEKLIRDRLDPICSELNYKRININRWSKDVDWCKKNLGLGLTTVGRIKQPNALGGASLAIGDMHRVFLRGDFEPINDQSPTIGAPVYAIDERLNSDSGHFNSLANLSEILPMFERAFTECVLPELERYQTEDDLLQALLAPDWLTSVKLFASQDRRGSLVALMIAKREGDKRATEWARAEVDRIKAEKPLVTSTARYQELLRTIAHLERTQG